MSPRRRSPPRRAPASSRHRPRRSPVRRSAYLFIFLYRHGFNILLHVVCGIQTALSLFFCPTGGAPALLHPLVAAHQALARLKKQWKEYLPHHPENRSIILILPLVPQARTDDHRLHELEGAGALLPHPDHQVCFSSSFVHYIKIFLPMKTFEDFMLLLHNQCWIPMLNLMSISKLVAVILINLWQVHIIFAVHCFSGFKRKQGGRADSPPDNVKPRPSEGSDSGKCKTC